MKTSQSEVLYVNKTTGVTEDLVVQVSLKADMATVNTDLALKADMATVNTDLALKADTTTVNEALALKLNKSELLNKTYPVGAVYMSVSATSPASLFGGTWAVYAAGRMLAGVNTGDADFSPVGKTGGSSSKQLTEAEMPNHQHLVTLAVVNQGAPESSGILNANVIRGAGFGNTTSGTAGNSHPFKILPPYIVVNMWQRTA